MPSTPEVRACELRLVGTDLAGRAPAGQLLLRRRRVRCGRGQALADRTTCRRGLGRGQDRAVRDGARVADAGDLSARHHRVLAAPGQCGRTGHPPPARRPARGARHPRGTVIDDLLRPRPRRRHLPARGHRRDGAEEPRPGSLGPGCDAVGDSAGVPRPRLRLRHPSAQRIGQRDPPSVQDRGPRRGQRGVHDRAGRIDRGGVEARGAAQ
jgi:hypothetical protein